MEDSDPLPTRIDPTGISIDSVPVGVARGRVGGVQLCPSLILNSQQGIAPAVKHVYSRLAACANELDQGIGDLLLVLIGNGNSLSQTYLSKFEDCLSSIVSKCSVWIITSGEAEDPLASAASNVIRTILPQNESESEVLHIGVNTYNVVLGGNNRNSVLVDPTTPMADASVNTLYALCKGTNENEEIADFRAHFAVRLAHPPPALLIGVPNEKTLSTGMTPQTSNAPPILLSPSSDSRPLPAVVFAGQSRASLIELFIFVENGFPVVVLQDSCELCDILYNGWLLYRTPSFKHDKFVRWLEAHIDDSTEHSTTVDDETRSKSSVELIIQIFAIAFGDCQLIEFVASDELPTLPNRLVELCTTVHSNPLDLKRALGVSAKLNLPTVLNAVDTGAVADEELWSDLLVEALTHGDRVDFLAAILERNHEFVVSGELLVRILNSGDQHFFNAVIMCQCLGYSNSLSEVDDSFCRHLEQFLVKLSHGVEGLFPHSFSSAVANGTAVQCLAVWMLLLHRPAQLSCLIAHTDHPIPTALVLSRVARSLSVEAHDWFFYEESLQQTARSLSHSALSLLESVHAKSPSKSYQVLCEPLEPFNGATLTQIAYQAHDQHFLAHECCQRWVHRLLYGHLQVRSGSFPNCLPKWIKLILSAFLVFPTRCWVALRPTVMNTNQSEKRCTSPTVALLESGRAPKKIRALSTFSMVSGRSEALTNITSPLLSHSAPAGVPMVSMQQMVANGGESVTPQSMVLPMAIEEIDSSQQQRHHKKKPHRRHKRRWTPPPLATFYSTPIVKYWVSLVFRLLHICVFAYSVLLPGCGSTVLDTIVWAWSLMTWIEQMYVVWSRNHTIPLKEMPWRVFEIVVTMLFLFGMFTLKLFGDQIINEEILPFNSVYPGKVLTSFFLLYFCYSTLFTYVPLSEIFGPIVIRVKLMILRDFTNFLIMVALVMGSSAVAVHAILFPDQPLTATVLQRSLSWAWLSLFTTDMSGLQESERCKQSYLGSPRQFCTSIGQYADATCPRQGWPGYVAVIEYFVLLKLILWPILFAFFAKTAKAVDEEADKIWKYQMYGLVTDFSMRPCVPPPFTFLFFIGAACCRARSCFSCCLSQTSYDHPDMVDGGPQKSYSIYRNPSIPFKKFEFIHAFWRQTAIASWTESRKKGNQNAMTSTLAELRNIRAQLRVLGLTNSYEKTAETKIRKVPYMNNSVFRLAIDENEKNWNTILPHYSPPFYSKPVEEFPVEMQRYVDNTTQQNVAELRRNWRLRQAIESQTQPCGFTLSGAGYPLNPNGRAGLVGRGELAKFGANHKIFYIIISGNGLESKILLQSNSLPNEWRYETGSRDENLTAILVNLGIAEGEAQVLSTRRLDVSDTGPAHIYSGPASSVMETDHAWVQHDVWAVCLRQRRVSASPPSGYTWQNLSTTGLSPEQSKWVSQAKETLNI